MALVPKEGGSMSYQVPILTSVNYPVWSVKVKSIMDAYGLWGTVEPRGLGEEPDEKKSKQALAFLFQAIPEDMVLQMASYTDPKQVWDGLKTRFLGVDRVRTARLATLRKELETMRMKEGETVDDFVAKLNGIASKVRSLGYELEERLEDSRRSEERLKGLGEKEEEQGQVLMAEHKYGEIANKEGVVEEAMVEVKEVEEEVQVEVVIKAGSGVLIVENFDTLAMSAQSGRTQTKRT
ncbi:hypothetical protein Tco_1325110 [Tanacetum coccineum]